MTAKERAGIDINSRRCDETVKPTASCFVGRPQRDFREGDTQLGAMTTAVHRDINDAHLDFMRDQAYTGVMDFSHYFRNPFSIFNRLVINTNERLDWDFGGTFQWGPPIWNSHATFRNNYNIGGGITRVGETTSNTALRVGATTRWPGSWEYGFHVNSDHWKRFHISFVRYVQQGDDDRYLIARLDRKTVWMTFRMDYGITSNLTVQYYGAPFVSVGRYSEFKRATNPRADKCRNRFSVFDDG